MEKENLFISHEKENHGDFRPEIIEEEDGSKTYRIRGVFPKIDSLKSMAEKKEEHFAQEEAIGESEGFEGFPPDYKKGAYDYKKMIPDCGSPSSIEMPSESRLTIGFVRHLQHENNLVSPETKKAFRPQAEKLVDSLNITPEDAVYVVTSTLASYVGNEKGETERFSRTDGTVEVIVDILKEKGIDFQYNQIEEGGVKDDSVIRRLRPALDEFPITSQSHYKEMAEKIKANIVAKKEGRDIPHPDLPKVDAAVFASFVDNQKELEKKTGIGEVSSATVARTLKGLEALDDHFLRGDNLPQGKKRAVVIVGGHGQFGTDISEALLVATDKNFPVLAAGNGGFFRINVALDEGGKSVKEFIINSKNIKG